MIKITLSEARKIGLDIDTEMLFGKNLHALFNEITDTIETLEIMIRKGYEKHEYIDDLVQLDNVINIFNNTINKSFNTVLTNYQIDKINKTKINDLKSIRKKMKFHVTTKRKNLNNIKPIPKINFKKVQN